MWKIQFEEREQTSESDLTNTKILEFSDWELKTTMVNMLRALVEKVYTVQKQIGNVSRKM